MSTKSVVCNCRMGNWEQFEQRLKQGQKVFSETDGTVYVVIRVEGDRVKVAWALVADGGPMAKEFNSATVSLNEMKKGPKFLRSLFHVVHAAYQTAIAKGGIKRLDRTHFVRVIGESFDSHNCRTP